MNAMTFEQLPQAVGQLVARLERIETLLLERKEQPTKEQPEQPFTVEQAAEFLNLSVPTIYGKVSKGELPVMKRGKRLYFSSKELLAYLKGGRKKTNQELAEEAEQYFKNKKGLNHAK